MVQLAGVAPKDIYDIFVNYKSFKNIVLQQGKLCPVAVVGDDVDAYWANDGMPAVREALNAFIAELE